MVDPVQLLKILGWITLGAFFVVLIGGMTNRLVVFFDTTDLVWSTTPYLFPLASVIAAWSIVPEGGKYWDSSITVFILALGLLGAVYGAYRALYVSSAHNGIVFGLFIGFFKLLIALVVAVLSLGLMGRAFDDRVSTRDRVKAAAFLAGLWWLVSKLINGEQYYTSRGLAFPRS